MTRTSDVPQRDLESLSAYLDDELSARDSARLRARLSKEAALRQALEELRGTVALLRSMPAAKPPRNFTLTPEMAGDAEPRRRTRGLWLQWATALAAATFVVLVGLDALAHLGTPMAMSPAVSELAAEVAGTPEAEAPPAMEPREEADSLRADSTASPTPTAGAELGFAGPSPSPTATPAPMELLSPEPAPRASLTLLRIAEALLGATVLVLAALSLRAWRRG